MWDRGPSCRQTGIEGKSNGQDCLVSFANEHDRDEFLCGEDSHEARRIIKQLRTEGFVAYLAGGCVRDALLGKQPKDYDVATDATPESVRKVFGRASTLAFGASFGVIGVLPRRSHIRDSDEQTIQPTEVATFRSDGTYSDGRRPDSVHFGDAEQDALRRDFTINGLFYDPEQHEIIDFVDGQADLRARLLRTIGDAASRIEEDKLRMLRAVRFATTLGFAVHPETVAAISTHADDIDTVSGERIGAEMRRVLTSPAAIDGLNHLRCFGLHRVVLPELNELDWKKFESIAKHLADRQFPNALACMLIAMAQPTVTMSKIAARWKLSNEECRQAGAAIKHWPTVRDSCSLPWSVVQPTLINRDAPTIVEVASAIVAADQLDDRGIAMARQALRWPAEKLDPPSLLTGDDLREEGIPAGPVYRSILQTIRDAQLNGTITSREEAIAALSDLA